MKAGFQRFSGSFLLWPHVLGLDAALIALLWQEIGARILHLSVNPAEQGALFCAVWGIYLCDRVWDVKRLPASQLPSLQHYWARRIPALFIILGLLNFLTAGVLAIRYLDRQVWRIGGMLGLCCGVYYILHGMSKKRGATLWRALLLGGLFAAGSLALPLAEFPGGWSRVIFLFAALALVLSANATACMQAEEGQIIQKIRERNHMRQNPLLLPALLVSTACALTTGNFAPLLAVTALGVVLLQRPRLSPDLFAALCDAVLLLPAVLLF